MPQYSVGDVVRICDKPNYDCPFGWADIDMDRYCGHNATIVAISHSAAYDIPIYRLDVDCRKWMWSEDCLEEIQNEEIEESNMDIMFLIS